MKRFRDLLCGKVRKLNIRVCRLSLTPYYLLLNPYSLFLTTGLLACAAGSAVAGSTHTFTNCNLPDTGQTVHYSTAPGDDSDYQPSGSHPDYTIYNPVGSSLVTVDNRTGLMWVTNPADAVMGGTYNWAGAIAACETLNYAGYGPGVANNGWRLPNIKELQSIVDYGRQNPSINTAYFFDTQSSYYWSSTTYIPNTSFAWLVYFYSGNTLYYNKTDSHYVRCVRAGP